jgi:DNA-binding response OmpR family regulator
MTAARPILIIEDDAAQREILKGSLSLSNEFAVTVAARLSEADTLLGAADARFDAVILDLGLPDGDGQRYLAKLRQQGQTMPIIVVTGSCDEADVVRGLEAGANDYVTKPFRQNELLARLRAQLRIFDNGEDATFTIGHYTFRPAAKLLIDHAKRRVRLTNKECQILKFLYRAGPKPVSRPVLLDEVWGYNSGVTTHTLETHIYRLRQKIEVDPTDLRILVSGKGGYCLNHSGTALTAAE